MRVGILGSGLMGGKLGAIFARAGQEVVFSYARSQDKLNKLAREAGAKARAGTPREAAQDADAILLAVHWLRIDDVLKQAGDLSGKAILTCSLPMAQRQGGPAEVMRPGDAVWFPPGERHWHGANPTTAMAHIAIQEKKNRKGVDWMERVSDEQYHAANNITPQNRGPCDEQ
jgi:threonine dehydrogenase-like Zn-dependent dehydrogenase